jgi:hypothetical protein
MSLGFLYWSLWSNRGRLSAFDGRVATLGSMFRSRSGIRRFMRIARASCCVPGRYKDVFIKTNFSRSYAYGCFKLPLPRACEVSYGC